jgi:radical SAM family uncharacterized protein
MKDKLNKILPTVRNPIQYVGNEVNIIKKKIEDIQIRFCLAFPDTYEIGMSHIGSKIIYGLLNNIDDVWCERVFAPQVDMEEKLISSSIPLYSLESYDPINKFDFLGFSLQYEMSYTNVLNMLNLGKIPLLSQDRTEDDPIVIAGGPCTCNPEPLADFIDLFTIGESEETLVQIIEIYRKNILEGKNAFLKAVAFLDGVYVPKFYDVEYNQDLTIKSFKANEKNLTATVKKVFVKNLDNAYFPDKVIVPYTEIVHDRIMLEIFRGCSRGCRFCQAGMIYRPVREKSLDTLCDSAEKLLKSSGYDEISLSSLSTTDYSCSKELLYNLVAKYQDQKISVSLPSLRIDSFSMELANEVQKVRKSGLTFAPEAGSQRMRDIINKGIDEENIISTVKKAFELGWGHIKLYFMIGLPYETMEDIQGIIDLANKLVNLFYEVDKKQRNKRIELVVSTSCFVPKPFTPFQWENQDGIDKFKEKQTYIKENMKSKKIKYRWHDPEVSSLEAVFARGDRRLGKVIYHAWKNGCKFDGWQEHFKYSQWISSFEACGIDPEFYSTRKRSYDEILPWDFIDIGVKKDFLIKENEKAKKQELTIDCRQECSSCGVMEKNEGWICNEFNQI